MPSTSRSSPQLTQATRDRPQRSAHIPPFLSFSGRPWPVVLPVPPGTLSEWIVVYPNSKCLSTPDTRNSTMM
jgi:hypothetical protein